LRDLLRSNWERMSWNDSLGSLLDGDSGLPGLDMNGYSLIVASAVRITP
jgi:hypothetical protein